MRKLILFAVMGFFLLVTACAGNSGLTVSAGSDQDSTFTASFGLLDAEIIASNEVGFDPHNFNVRILKVNVLQGIGSDWQTVYSGSQVADIVSAVDLVATPVAIPDGEYRGVGIEYVADWDVHVTVLSNELPTVMSSASNEYYYTNNSSTTNMIYFATADLKSEVLNQFPTAEINDLSASIVFERGKDYVLKLIFKTANMIRVWTNTSGSGLDAGPEYLQPDLDMQSEALN